MYIGAPGISNISGVNVYAETCIVWPYGFYNQTYMSSYVHHIWSMHHKMYTMLSRYISSCELIDTYSNKPKKYAHGFVVLCFVVVMQSFIMNSHEVLIHICQGCFAGTGAIVRLPQCQWSKPDGYGKISQCITTTKQNKAKTVCIFLGIYCTLWVH